MLTLVCSSNAGDPGGLRELAPCGIVGNNLVALAPDKGRNKAKSQSMARQYQQNIPIASGTLLKHPGVNVHYFCEALRLLTWKEGLRCGIEVGFGVYFTKQMSDELLGWVQNLKRRRAKSLEFLLVSDVENDNFFFWALRPRDKKIRYGGLLRIAFVD